MSRTNVPPREDPTQRSPRALADEHCDRCCAPGCVYVVLPSGLDLVLCSHHGREHERALRASGALMRVDRHRAGLYW
jgi:hypothetical protein